MKNYCGIDLGKKSSHFHIVDEERVTMTAGKFANHVDAIQKVFAKRPSMRIVVEASCKAFWMADRLKELGHEVIVVDPGRTKAIGAARIKHDKLDARVLAELCQTGLVAAVDIPTLDQRMARLPFTSRVALVRSRTVMTNNVQSILDSEGVELPARWTGGFVAVVREAKPRMPPAMVPIIERLLRGIEEMSKLIDECDQVIEVVAENDPDIKLLRTAPGVGPLTAAAFVQVIRDPSRFKSGRLVAAYLGLVPSLYASGQTMVKGPITKHGNVQLRWLLHIAASALLRTLRDTTLKRWAARLAERIGRKKAKTAIARKLATILWSMWRRRTPFEARLPVQEVAAQVG
jgi:transposase